MNFLRYRGPRRLVQAAVRDDGSSARIRRSHTVARKIHEDGIVFPRLGPGQVFQDAGFGGAVCRGGIVRPERHVVALFLERGRHGLGVVVGPGKVPVRALGIRVQVFRDAVDESLSYGLFLRRARSRQGREGDGKRQEGRASGQGRRAGAHRSAPDTR